MLRTDRTVFTRSASNYQHLQGLEAALSRGVAAVPDSKRPGFYEIEIGDNWYYLCIPKTSLFVCLIAARKISREYASSVDRSAQHFSMAV